MKIGSMVVIEPTNMASSEFKSKVMAIGEVKGKVIFVSGIGVCTVKLKKGIKIDGHTHSLPGKKGCRYVDIHKAHLKLI